MESDTSAAVPTKEELKALTGKFAAAYSDLSSFATEINDALEIIRRQNIAKLKKLVEAAKTAKHDLANAIDRGQGLFVSPRTMVLDGIKIGLKKQKKKHVVSDEPATIAAIKRLMSEQASILVGQVEALNLAAVKALTPKELEDIGITIKGGKDAIVIKCLASNVDKVVAALMGDETKEASKEADDDDGDGDED